MIIRVFFAAAFFAALAFMPPITEAALYQRYLNGACTDPTVCNINFPVVPAGKTLQITNVSCYWRVFGSPNVGIYAEQLLLIAANGTTILSAVTLQPELVSTLVGGRSVYSSNQTILAFAAAGQRFRAWSLLDGSTTHAQFACHISGQLLP